VKEFQVQHLEAKQEESMEIRIRINDKLVRGMKKIFSRRVLPFVLAVVLSGVTVSLMAQSFVIPFVFKSGEVISSSQMNANFTDIADSISALMSAVDGLSEGGGSLWVSSGTDYYVLGKEVGIGLTAPASLLHAYTTKAIGQGEDAGITVESAIADNPPFLGLGIPTKPLVKIWRNPADDSLKFDTGGATRMTLDTAGTLSVARIEDTASSSYYVDPSSTSHLGSLETRGWIASGESGSAGRIRVLDSTGTVERFVADGTTGNMGLSGIAIIAGGGVIGAPTAKANLNVYGIVTADAHLLWSDARLKKKIEPLQGSLGKLTRLQGVSFEWENAESGRQESPARQIGLVAQDVEAVFPELVTETAEGYLALSYDQFTAVLIEAIKELKAQNDLLLERVAALEAR
jgi:hypothetical protein